MPLVSYHSVCCRQLVLCSDSKWNGAFRLSSGCWGGKFVQITYMHRWKFKTAQICQNSHPVPNPILSDSASVTAHCETQCVVSPCVIFFSAVIFIHLFFLFTCSPISPRSFSRSSRGGPGSLCFLLNCAAYPIPKARITSLLFLCCLCFTHYRHKSVRNPREQNAREQNGCALV